MINSVKAGAVATPVSTTKEKTKVSSDSTLKEGTGTENDNGVILELGKKDVQNATYDKPVSKKLNSEEIEKLKEQSNRANATLRKIVEDLILRQGKNIKDVLSGKETVIVDDKAKSEAEQLISENGEYGVKAVSDRIVGFAKALSQGDKTKIPELRNAIEEGFKQAEKILGGALPDICKKTHDEVMKQLDNWANE